jgi:hypothetical protein
VAGDRDQQLPEIVAVLEPRVAAVGHPAAEALHGAERHVFLVVGPARQARHLMPSQQNQLVEIRFPNRLGPGLVSGGNRPSI